MKMIGKTCYGSVLSSVHSDFGARVLQRGGGYGDSAGPAGTPRGRVRSIRGICGLGYRTSQGHRRAGARRELARSSAA